MTCLQTEVVPQKANGFLADKANELAKEKGLEGSHKLILHVARSTETKIMCPMHVPTRRHVYCVLRSPNVNKDSREHFDIRTINVLSSRLIELENPNAQTIDALMQLDIPAGVDLKVKLL
ncbi:hypothetical protein L7F22_052047 [Adiantum nelumboides]|nr:hypothetical protein [Adiantum nelumboides]